MSEHTKITADHLRRCAVVYVRQSSSTQATGSAANDGLSITQTTTASAARKPWTRLDFIRPSVLVARVSPDNQRRVPAAMT
jgi:hypothetical protein